MVDELIVYLRERRVGVLSQREGRLAFCYDEEWLQAPERHPLSLSLPLRKEPFADAATRPGSATCCQKGMSLRQLPADLGAALVIPLVCWSIWVGSVPARSV